MDSTIITNDGLAVGDTAETNMVEVTVPYMNISIDPILWQDRFQDLGCQKE